MSFTYNGYTLNEYLEEPWYDTEINLFKGILSKLPNFNSSYVGNQHYHSRVADPNGVYPNSLFIDASGVTNVTELMDDGLNSGTHAVIATNGLLASATTFANFGTMFTDFASVISSYATGADYSGHNTQLALGGATSALAFASTLTYNTTSNLLNIAGTDTYPGQLSIGTTTIGATGDLQSILRFQGVTSTSTIVSYASIASYVLDDTYNAQHVRVKMVTYSGSTTNDVWTVSDTQMGIGVGADLLSTYFGNFIVKIPSGATDGIDIYNGASSTSVLRLGANASNAAIFTAPIYGSFEWCTSSTSNMEANKFMILQTGSSTNSLNIFNTGSATPSLILISNSVASNYTTVYQNQSDSNGYLDAGQKLYLRARGGDINIDSTITLASTISLLAGTTTGKILLQAGVASGATISLKTQTNTYMTMADDGFTFSVQESGNTPHATALQLVADSGGNACIGFYAAVPIGRQSAITPPSGGSIVDGQARNAIDTIITVLQNIGVTF